MRQPSRFHRRSAVDRSPDESVADRHTMTFVALDGGGDGATGVRERQRLERKAMGEASGWEH